MTEGGRYLLCDDCNIESFSLNLPWNQDSITLQEARKVGWHLEYNTMTQQHYHVCPKCRAKLQHIPEDVVERFARAWASIDGRLDRFELGKKWMGSLMDDPGGGSYAGYMEDARELLKRADYARLRNEILAEAMQAALVAINALSSKSD